MNKNIIYLGIGAIALYLIFKPKKVLASAVLPTIIPDTPIVKQTLPTTDNFGIVVQSYTQPTL